MQRLERQGVLEALDDVTRIMALVAVGRQRARPGDPGVAVELGLAPTDARTS